VTTSHRPLASRTGLTDANPSGVWTEPSASRPSSPDAYEGVVGETVFVELTDGGVSGAGERMPGMDHRHDAGRASAGRRIAEDSRHELAVAISYKGRATGKLMPAHLYCSTIFEERFRWQATGRAHTTMHRLFIAARWGQVLKPPIETDVHWRMATIEIEPLHTPQAVFILFRPVPVKSKLRSMI
jgi:hypothetical protein